MLFHQSANSKGNYHYDLSFYNDVFWLPHFHRNLELIYVSEGEVTVFVDDEKELICQGQYALILPNQIHAYHSDSHSVSWIFVFSEEYVPEFLSLICNRQGKHSVFSCNHFVDKLLQTELTKSNSSVLMKKACLYAACDSYLQQAQLIDKKTTNNHIGFVIDYISKNYRENITLKHVAQKSGYEYHYLSRLLNQGYNINFRELVNEYRIEYAKELLRKNENSIADVAMLSGFQSIRSFNYIFKSITGKTPKEFCGNI